MRQLLKLACVLACACAPLCAQPTSASLAGRVTDTQGFVIPGATVVLIDKRTRQKRTVSTDEYGRYVFNVPPGQYEVAVSIGGFKEEKSLGLEEFAVGDVAVGYGQARTLDIPLDLTPDTRHSRLSLPPPPQSVELTWNAWAEARAPRPSFRPLAFLEPDGKNYSLIIDLAAFRYRDGEGVFSRGVGGKLREWLLATNMSSVDLKLLVMPDESYFEPPSPAERVQTLNVNLDRVRAALEHDVTVGQDAFEALRKNRDAEFKFGRVSVKLRTRDGEHATGVGNVAVAVWVDDVMPIDEFSVPLCVARDQQAARACQTGGAVQDSLAGIDPIRAAAQEHAYKLKPDAALHFVDLGDATVGVFRDNSWPPNEYVHWKLPDSVAGLRNYLQATLLPNFDRATDDETLLRQGAELYKLLFPDPAANKARVAFTKFVRAHLGHEEDANPPSIFVRLLADSSEPQALIPLGLMAYEVDGTRDFLGYHFRIQTPLRMQDYQPITECISKWVVLAPPANPDEESQDVLDIARRGITDWFGKWQFAAIDDIGPFADWIGAEADETNPVALFLLAHHDTNSLFFKNNNPLGAMSIDRRFKYPTVAIVNACGSASPGASKVVQQLNLKGVSAIIATAMEIDGHLAGDYFAVLAQILARNSKDLKYPLGLAHFRAVRQLGKVVLQNSNQPAYGAKALAYELLGNSNLYICTPPDKK